MNRFKNVLCMVDPWEPDRALVARARALARENQAVLTFAAVVETGPADAPWRRWWGVEGGVADPIGERTVFLESFLAEDGGGAAVKVLSGRPYLEIIREVLREGRDLAADLVVMGTVARTGIPGFFIGNTAEGILHQLDCSVLAIKPPGFVTPVVAEG